MATEGVYSECVHFTDEDTEVAGLTQVPSQSSLVCGRVGFPGLVDPFSLLPVCLCNSNSKWRPWLLFSVARPQTTSTYETQERGSGQLVNSLECQAEA